MYRELQALEQRTAHFQAAEKVEQTDDHVRKVIDHMTGNYMKFLRNNGDHYTTEDSVRRMFQDVARSVEKKRAMNNGRLV